MNKLTHADLLPVPMQSAGDVGPAPQLNDLLHAAGAAVPPMPKPAPKRVDPRSSLRRYQLIGLLAIAGMFGGLGGWAALAEIAGAVVAPGVVSVEGNSKKVQHLEGGIISWVGVHNADSVQAGQTLAKLDDTETLAALQITQSQLEELLARRGRLIAERDGSDTVEVPAQHGSGSEQAGQRATAWRGQLKLFEARRNVRLDKDQQLADRANQLKEVISGLQAQMKSKKQQLNYLRDELGDLVQLQDEQLVAKPRVLAMRRELSRLEGELGQAQADVAKTEGQIAESKLQLTEYRQTLLSEVLTELRDVEAKISELQEREIAAKAKLKRLTITAPIDGVVHKLTVFTVGGVIAAGETLMEIVPKEAKFVLDGQIEPNSIDQVAVGQLAIARFSAFDRHNTPELEGQVISVSADVRQDAPQMPRYYAVRVRLNDGEEAKLNGSKLVPGMPVELLMRRGDRTVLAYLAKPLVDQFAHVFRER